MGYEIKPGIDNDIREALDITSTDVAFASRVVDVLDALQSSKNALGDAAGKSTGTASGEIPVININNKIATSVIDTATAGGVASAGKIPLLGSTGLISSSLIPAVVSASGGVKYVWKYDRYDTWGNSPTTTNSNRQYAYTWRPRDNNDAGINVTTLIVYVTAGGGCGSFGPSASGNRKGGGGAGGGTAIRIFTNLNSSSSISVLVGQGGAARAYNSNAVTHNGANSTFGAATAIGGSQGTSGGLGGNATRTTIDQQGYGVYIPGQSGGCGMTDKFGGGYGGGSYWGGGFPPNEGQGSGNGLNAAPGAGGGGAHGHSEGGVFTANQAGTRGNDGLIVVIGF